MNIFWSHASQRAKCRDFGDVITFDMTHKTNKHRMPLGMFVGSNHQLQNVIFGQALMRDESADSFKWLFTIFKTCMGGHEPHVLLTGKGVFDISNPSYIPLHVTCFFFNFRIECLVYVSNDIYRR
jgi:hypothetical protein